MKSLKNILIIFVATIFLASSIGVSFINHTCTSCKTSEVKLFANHEHSCSSVNLNHCCSTNNSETNNTPTAKIKITNNHTEHSCCKDEVIIVKIKSVFIPSLFNYNFTNIFIIVNNFKENFITNTINNLNHNFLEQIFVFEKISSPTLSKISRFIL